MGAAILSFPFRLALNGSVATVDQDSDQADAEQVGVLIATRQGERELAPTFGMPDPVGRGFNTAALVAGINVFGPPIALSTVDVVNNGNDTQTVTVSF